MMGIFCENSERLLALNYFHKKTSIIDIWHGSKYTPLTHNRSILRSGIGAKMQNE